MTTFSPSRRYPIPQSSQPFHFSRAALGLLSATLVLVVILVFSTLQNINRAEMLMEKFLLDKGQTVLRSIEAGSRATMMHQMGGGNPFHTLLEEFVKDRDIHHISIIGMNGDVLEQVGAPSEPDFSMEELEHLLASETMATKLVEDRGIFTLYTLFEPAIREHGMHMRSRLPEAFSRGGRQRTILSIGLLTHQFDTARQQDVNHTIFMGAILFLVGSAGLYFLFLYQKVRLTSSRLADMKVYTQNIIESIPVGILTLDAGNRIVSCNENIEDLTSHSEEDIQGREFHSAMSNCPLSIEDACESPIGYETECTDASGKQVPLRISCSPLLSNENIVIGKVLIFQDLSLLKEMEVQLERTRRMAALGKMAAGIAHEIRNPLGTLRGFAQFFGNQPEANEDGKNYSQLMISEIDRLNQTVSGLLQFSRPREPQLQDIHVDRLFAKTVSMMEADVFAKNVELQVQGDTGAYLRTDPDLLLQVLMNLLRNSIRAAPMNGVISLDCAVEENFIKLTVTDNGYGMSEDVRERMFDPFFTTTRSGTGLGLAVSHQIIEQHGGFFEVQTGPDAGTSIAIHLPK